MVRSCMDVNSFTCRKCGKKGNKYEILDHIKKDDCSNHDAENKSKKEEKEKSKLIKTQWFH